MSAVVALPGELTSASDSPLASGRATERAPERASDRASERAPERAGRAGHKLRALRHLVGEFEVGPIEVTAWHPRLSVLRGACEDLSLNGLCLRIKGSLLPGEPGTDPSQLVQVDDRVIGLHATLRSGEVVCNTDAVVRHARLEGGDLLIGLQLQRGVVDLPLLYERQTRDKFSARCDEVERTADSRLILPQFKSWVSDLRDYLERMRAFLDREEAALSDEDQHTYGQICQQYLAEVGPRIVQRVHEASHEMGKMLGGLSEDEHVAHRAYAQHHLGALFGAAPFIRRAQHKPLGYAGDYEMMNMLYRSPAEGPSLFAKVVNQCAATEIAARANINRITFLGDKLRTVIRRAAATGERARVASIGSGPAREIEALLESEPELGPYLDVALVDQDPRAVQYCERRLTPLAQRTGAGIHFVRESVRRLLCGGMLSHTLGPRQLIYSAGLFDYLSDRSFTALLGALFGALAPGGQMLIGNVDVSNPTRYFMEYFAEWFLIHRTRGQLLDCAKLLRPAPRAARVESEPLGVNLFLVIEK